MSALPPRQYRLYSSMACPIGIHTQHSKHVYNGANVNYYVEREILPQSQGRTHAHNNDATRYSWLRRDVWHVLSLTVYLHQQPSRLMATPRIVTRMEAHNDAFLEPDD